VRRIEESPALAGATAPTIQRIDFVAVLIDDQNLDELCKRVAAAVTALTEAGALVEGLTGSLLFATFGVIRAGDSTRRPSSGRKLFRRSMSNLVKVCGSFMASRMRWWATLVAAAVNSAGPISAPSRADAVKC
jgi:hypothetical protein